MVDQAQTGNIVGEVTDDKGQGLPGVTVTVSGGSAPWVQVTDEYGKFSFLGLAPGDYGVKAELGGFAPTNNPNVRVQAGISTPVEMTLSVAEE